MQSHNFTILFSLISLGFFGGFSHCAGMCGPFVLSQVSSRLQKTSIEQFSRIKSFALIPYHVGRIFTYSFIGFFCSLITKNLKEIENFNFISGLLILLAAALFAKNLLSKKISSFKKIKPLSNFLQLKLKKLTNLFDFLRIKILAKLKISFKAPEKINVLFKKFENRNNRHDKKI